MVESARSDAPAPAPHCPWCSALLPDPAATRCPACGAALRGDDHTGIPGVTEIDPNAIRRAPLPLATPTLGSLLMGGVATERPSPAELEAVAAPDDAVRREMLHLEIEARRAELEHEANALAGELAAEEALRRAGVTGKAAFAPLPATPLPATSAVPATPPLPATPPVPAEPLPSDVPPAPSDGAPGVIAEPPAGPDGPATA